MTVWDILLMMAAVIFGFGAACIVFLIYRITKK